MTMIVDPAIHGARTQKSGRPLGEKAIAIHDAVIDLTTKHTVMTVRQVFYALVVRGIVPKDEAGGYRPVQTQLLRMRHKGLLPWSFIADTTRWIRKPRSYDSAADALAGWASTYRRNLWLDQNIRVEVWLEKDALAGIVMEATLKWDVPLMVSRGTSSVTFLHSAGEAASDAWACSGVETHVFTLYDFDAAGERAACSVERGLVEHADGAPVHVQRLAVTAEQITEWGLPTRPAKKTDPQAATFGDEAVELDAIPPDRLIALVDTAIEELVDPDALRVAQIVEEDERGWLMALANRGLS